MLILKLDIVTIAGKIIHGRGLNLSLYLMILDENGIEVKSLSWPGGTLGQA